MATIYLKHPVHGAKVAVSPEEAAYDKTHGWLEFDPTAVAAAPAAQPEAPSLDAPQAPILNALPSRRGRPRKGESQGE